MPMPRAAVASGKGNGTKREWCPESMVERPWNVERVKSLFGEAEARFNAVRS